MFVEVETGFVGMDADVVVPSDTVDDAFDGVVVDAAAFEFAASLEDEVVDVGVALVEGFRTGVYGGCSFGRERMAVGDCHVAFLSFFTQRRRDAECDGFLTRCFSFP